jgi:outer membrane protein TolC
MPLPSQLVESTLDIAHLLRTALQQNPQLALLLQSQLISDSTKQSSNTPILPMVSNFNHYSNYNTNSDHSHTSSIDTNNCETNPSIASSFGITGDLISNPINPSSAPWLEKGKLAHKVEMNGIFG